MKKYLLFAALLSLASCEIYIFEDPYVNYDARDQFVGNYRVEEYSQTTEQAYRYNIVIQKSCCNAEEVRISNFYGSNLDVYAIVYNDRITIPLQIVDGYEIEGTGRMDYDRLKLTFVVRDLYAVPAFTDFVDANAVLY